MGAPDDFLDLDPPLSDSAKYRMVGNSGACPILTFLGIRIIAAELGLLGDEDFVRISELAASGDPEALLAVQDWVERTLGTPCRRD